MNRTIKAVGMLLAICLVATMAVSLVSCNSNGEDATTTTTTTVTTTTTTTTEKKDETPDTPVTVEYKVTVKDQNGDPVVGAAVQMCIGELCKLPVLTDDSGVATFNVDEESYTVKFNSLPDGYTDAVGSYTFEEGSRELTITVTKNA